MTFFDTMPTIEPYGEEDFKLLVTEDLNRTRTLMDETRTKLTEVAPRIWKDPAAALAVFDEGNRIRSWGDKYGYTSLIKFPEAFGELVEEGTAAAPTLQAKLLAKAFVHDNLTLHLLELMGSYFVNAQEIMDVWARRDAEAPPPEGGAD